MAHNKDSEEHEPEMDFSDKVEQYLIDNYGADNVERNKYLSEPRRYVDFWVETPLDTKAIEVENDFEAVFEGVGQSIMYAHGRMGVSPLIIVPSGHVEFPEARALNERVTIVQLEL